MTNHRDTNESDGAIATDQYIAEDAARAAQTNNKPLAGLDTRVCGPIPATAEPPTQAPPTEAESADATYAPTEESEEEELTAQPVVRATPPPVAPRKRPAPTTTHASTQTREEGDAHLARYILDMHARILADKRKSKIRRRANLREILARSADARDLFLLLTSMTQERSLQSLVEEVVDPDADIAALFNAGD